MLRNKSNHEKEQLKKEMLEEEEKERLHESHV